MEMDRRTFIGGSDAAAILGVSPWTTPVDLYLKKISEAPEPELALEKRRFFARRKQQEPVIARMLEEEYGIVVIRLSLDENPNRYTDADLPFLRAEIDFEFEMSDSVREHFPEREDFASIPNGAPLNGEIKTVHPFKASEWGEQGSEGVPIHYAAQVMHGLGVTRRPAAIVAALFGLDNLLCFPVMADSETIADMRQRCEVFWRDNVMARIPPDPVNLDDISRLYTMRAGRPVDMDEQGMRLLRAVGRLRYEAKRIEEEEETARFDMARYITSKWGISAAQSEDSIDNAILRYQGIDVGSWKRQRGAYLDQKSLKTSQPELIKQYTIERYARILRIAKGV